MAKKKTDLTWEQLADFFQNPKWFNIEATLYFPSGRGQVFCMDESGWQVTRKALPHKEILARFVSEKEFFKLLEKEFAKSDTNRIDYF